MALQYLRFDLLFAPPPANFRVSFGAEERFTTLTPPSDFIKLAIVPFRQMEPLMIISAFQFIRQPIRYAGSP